GPNFPSWKGKVVFASRRKRSLVGLDITTSSVKLIELTESGRGYRVESYAAERDQREGDRRRRRGGRGDPPGAQAGRQQDARGRDCDQRRRGDHESHPDAEVFEPDRP